MKNRMNWVVQRVLMGFGAGVMMVLDRENTVIKEKHEKEIENSNVYL